MFLLVYLFVHSGPMDLAFYGAETRHQGTPTPRIYPLLLLAVGCKHTAPRFRSPRICPPLLLAAGRKHTAPRFRSPRIYPLLLLAFGRKHTAPRFHSPRVYPLLLLAVGRKHTAPRLPTPQVGSIFHPQTAPNNTVGCPRDCIKIFPYKQSFTFWYSSVSAPSAYPLCLYTMSPLPSSSSV